MADKSGQTFEMPRSSSLVAEIFSTQQDRDEANREKVIEIPLSEIGDFPNHPFKVKMNDEMMEMAQSIKQYGVLVPGLVRPKDGGGYEMVSGHRRKMASELAEKETMPCIVRNLADDEAVVIMVDSNLQREKILPSEKAYAYKMKLDAMKRQGHRTDLSSVPVAQKSNGKTSRELIGEQAGESQDQVRRYIRLTELIPQLLKMVDDGKIGFQPAVELSYISKQHQKYMLSIMEAEQATPSLSQAKKLKGYSQDGFLDEEKISKIMQEQKPNQKEIIRIPHDRVESYLKKGMTPVEAVEFLISLAAEHHQRTLQRQLSRDAR